jgi:hypothetical protein
LLSRNIVNHINTDASKLVNSAQVLSCLSKLQEINSEDDRRILLSDKLVARIPARLVKHSRVKLLRVYIGLIYFLFCIELLV